MLSKKLIFLSCLCLSTYTFAATTSTLWGDIDEPVEPIVTTPAVPVAPEPPSKTICEVLTAQPTLDLTGLNSTELLTQMRTSLQAMPDEYKALIANNEGIAKLYQEYRAKYLKVYCTK